MPANRPQPPRDHWHLRGLNWLLLRLADDFGTRKDSEVAVGLPLTEQEIATLIGTSRQTVSGALGEMIRAGLVVRRARELVVADPRTLRQVAGV